jgi:hypothetical protein
MRSGFKAWSGLNGPSGFHQSSAIFSNFLISASSIVLRDGFGAAWSLCLGGFAIFIGRPFDLVGVVLAW